MALVLKLIYENYIKYVHESKDPRLDNYLFVESAYPVAAILIAYIYFVKKFGPKFMENRQAFELKAVMIVYNALQVILNLMLGFRVIFYMIFEVKLNWLCHPIDYSGSEMAHFESRLVYYYYLLKITDLLDTVFFILRKKYNQVTFLHVYHHITMVVALYLGSRYLPGGHASMIGIVNCFVHGIMYFYYFLTCIRPEMKASIWWKKHITQIQIIQFSVLILFCSIPLIVGNCSYPKVMLVLAITQNLFMLVLFSDFYYKAYLKKKPENSENKIK